MSRKKAKALIGIGALVLAAVYFLPNLIVLLSNSQFSFQSFFVISVFHLIFLVISAYRFLIVIRVDNQGMGLLEWFDWYVEARILNKFLPQAGNVYRGYRLKIEKDIKISSYAGAYLFLAWIDTLLIMLLFVIGLSFLPQLGEVGNYLIFTASAFLGFIVAIPFIEKLPLGAGAASKSKAVAFVIVKIAAVATSVKKSIKIDLIFKLLVLGVVSFIFMAVRIKYAFAVYGLNVGLEDIALLFAIYKLGTSVVITPGNIGVQEGSMAAASELLGYGAAAGLAVSILLRLYGYALFFIVWLFYRGKSLLTKGDEIAKS